MGFGLFRFWSYLRSIRSYHCIHDLKKQYQGSLGSEDAAKSVCIAFKILTKLGLCSSGQRGGSIRLVKPSDPQVVSPLTARIAVLLRLPSEKVRALMITRDANENFSLSAFDDLIQRLSPKIIAFWNAEDGMRRDDKSVASVPNADAAVSSGSLASAPTVHGAASVRSLVEAHDLDEEEPVCCHAPASLVPYF